MVNFEGYSRRIKQIEAVLKENGIASLEEADQICKDKGLDVAQIVKDVQQMLQKFWEKDSKHFVFLDLLQILVKLVLGMEILRQCFLEKRHHALHFVVDTNRLLLLKEQSVLQILRTKHVKSRSALSSMD